MWATSFLAQKSPGTAGDGLWNLVALVILVLDIVVIVAVWRSRKAFIPKIVWTILILILPLAGLILYFFLGREK